MNRVRVNAWLCLFILAAGTAAWAIPAHMSVSGRLLDASGNPVNYYYPGTNAPRRVFLPAQVKLYDSETTTTPFAVLSATAEAFDAYFYIRFAVPNSAVTKNALWYSLAIDADQNGLTSADDFPDRFEIGSVPFAMSARPVHYFTTFGGSYGAVFHSKPANFMQVCPFETPSGGVEFNRMNIVLNSASVGTKFEFGIFDLQGNRVVSSGLIEIKGADVNRAFLEIKLSNISLQPSAFYYVGLARNVTAGYSFQKGIKPCTPVLGWVPIPTGTGALPPSFDLNTIEPDIDVTALPVTLSLATNPSKPESGWNGKPGGPQYRWVQSQPSTCFEVK